MLQEFSSNIMMNNYSIIIVTETWLNNNINDAEFRFQNYTVFRMDRNSESIIHGKAGELVF